MRYTIQFSDDLMCLVDSDGCGHDAFEVDASRPEAARKQLATWAKAYALDLPRERRRLDRQLAAMTEEVIEG